MNCNFLLFVAAAAAVSLSFSLDSVAVVLFLFTLLLLCILPVGSSHSEREAKRESCLVFASSSFLFALMLCLLVKLGDRPFNHKCQLSNYLHPSRPLFMSQSQSRLCGLLLLPLLLSEHRCCTLMLHPSCSNLKHLLS